MSARSRRAPWFRPDPATLVGGFALEDKAAFDIQEAVARAFDVPPAMLPGPGAANAEREYAAASESLREYADGYITDAVSDAVARETGESMHVRFTSSEQAFAFRGRFVDGVFVTETRVNGEWVPYVEPDAGDGD